MRTPHSVLIVLIGTLLPPCIRAQDAVLVLSPGPTTAIRAGSGKPGFSGDNGDARAAQLASPAAMAQDAAGNLYLADTRNHRIRRLTPAGIITTIAGTGAQGFSGDNGLATAAQLDSPAGIAVAPDGKLFIADTRNHRIRSVDPAGVIRTVAGTGIAGFSGDNGPSTLAQISSPGAVAIGSDGSIYIADTANHRVRRVDATGDIRTVAGDGSESISPNGTRATTAHLDAPAALAFRPDGALLIADRRNDRIAVLNTDGTLSTLGTGSMLLRRPAGVAINNRGEALVADTGNFRVAQLTATGSGVALGSGEQGSLNTAVAPAQTAFGAPSSVLTGSNPADFFSLDREHGQVIQVAAAQLSFPDTVVATTSLTRSLTLKNSGTTALTIAGLTIPQPFTRQPESSCGTPPFTLPSDASCTLALSFSPQAEGAAAAVLQVTLESGAPQRAVLSGLGLRGGTLLPSTTTLQTSGTIVSAGTPLTLTAQVLGSTATAPTGTVLFSDGTTELGRSPLSAALQASFSTISLQTGAHTLTARYAGDTTYRSSVSVAAQIAVVAAPDFTLAMSGSNRISLRPGDAGAVALTVQPLNGVLNGIVSISVDGLPQTSTVNVTPVPITLAGDPVAVNIAFKLPVTLVYRQHSGFVMPALLPCFFLVRRRRMPLLMVLLCFAIAATQGCGGGYLSGNSVSSQSTSTTYPITITATCKGVTGEILTHTATLTLVVQP